MNRRVLEVTGVGKTFPVATRGHRLGAWWRALRGVDHARGRRVLDDVHLEMDRGEAVAILGPNGAGKSTLLKIIAGVLVPSAGRCRVHGRVGALLELGAGFQPELSGRQNLRNAALLAGLEPAECESAIASMIEFSGLTAVVDQPLKTYSSGMVVRLGFATMTALKPDLLISDEVLSVGDEAFQKKCIAWVERYLADGGSLLLVSHSIYHVQKLCQRALWLHEGKVRDRGDVYGVCQRYLAWHEDQPSVSGDRAPLANTGHITGFSVCPAPSGGVSLQADLGGAARAIAVELRRTDGALVASTVVPDHDGPVTLGSDHQWLPGSIRVEARPLDGEGRPCGARVRQLVQFSGQAREFGSVRLPHRWLSP